MYNSMSTISLLLVFLALPRTISAESLGTEASSAPSTQDDEWRKASLKDIHAKGYELLKADLEEEARRKEEANRKAEEERRRVVEAEPEEGEEDAYARWDNNAKRKKEEFQLADGQKVHPWLKAYVNNPDVEDEDVHNAAMDKWREEQGKDNAESMEKQMDAMMDRQMSEAGKFGAMEQFAATNEAQKRLPAQRIRCPVCQHTSKYLAEMVPQKDFSTESEIERYLKYLCGRDCRSPSVTCDLTMVKHYRLKRISGEVKHDFKLELPANETELARLENATAGLAEHGSDRDPPDVKETKDAVAEACWYSVGDNMGELAEFFFINSKKLDSQPETMARKIEMKLCTELTGACRESAADREKKKRRKKEEAAKKKAEAKKASEAPATEAPATEAPASKTEL